MYLHIENIVCELSLINQQYKIIKFVYKHFMPLKTETINLNEYPDQVDTLQLGDQLTIGDLHGNSVKLIYFLIKQGVLKFNKGADDYSKIVEIYNKEPLETADLDTFKDILNRATFAEHAQKAMIRLIGDEVADRGNNDYFTLLVLKKLQENGIQTEIVLSNHGAEFVRFYEEGCKENFHPSISPTTSITGNSYGWGIGTPSYDKGLIKLITDKVVSKEEVTQLIEDSYKPKLKLISYAIDQTTVPPAFNIYTHGTAGLNTIKELALAWQIKYKDSSLEELSKTIDAINEKFYVLVKNQQVTEKFSMTGSIENIFIWIGNSSVTPNEEPRRPSTNDSTKNFCIKYIHGHIGEYVSPESNIINLDTNLGRPNVDNGKYLAEITNVSHPIPTIKIPTTAEPIKTVSPALLDEIEKDSAWMPTVIGSDGKFHLNELETYLTKNKDSILNGNTAKVNKIEPTEINDQSTWEVESSDGKKSEIIMRGNDTTIQFLSKDNALIQQAVAMLQNMSISIPDATIKATGFKLEELKIIIQQAAQINSSDSTEKICIKFDIDSIDPTQKELIDFIKIHNSNIARLSEGGTLKLEKLSGLVDSSGHTLPTLKARATK